MAVSQSRPGTGLLAILLITRPRPGPRLVFYYPETPSRGSSSPRHDEILEDSDSDSHEDGANPRRDEDVVASIVPDEARDDKCWDTAPHKTVLGLSIESLEKVLSPGRWSDKKKFEINMNGLSFVGHPMYASEGNEWSTQQTMSKSSPRSNGKDASDMSELDLNTLNLTFPPPPSRSQPQHDFMHNTDSFESQAEAPLGTSMQTTSSTGSDPSSEQIAMFHVVFVLRGTGLAAQAEVAAMYQGVARKLSKALHYCQKQANYVTTESRRILALRSKARQHQIAQTALWANVIENSELAWALKQVYERAKIGEIAGIRLNGMEMSLQVSESVQPFHRQTRLDPLSALLLLEPREAMLRELSHPDAAPLAAFIREHTPTKNLRKHASYVGMPVDDVLYLASHLIKWGKAQIISPLHQRNTYVVSPSAPTATLSQHMHEYHRLFPTLPNLPNMLKVLSGKPIKYGLLIPSRDHRTAYMNILAYLVRQKFLVQLKTYGWLKLPKSLLEQAPVFPRTETLRRPATIRNSLLSPQVRPVDEDALSESSERTAIASPSTPYSGQGRRFSRETQISTRDQVNKQTDTFTIVASPTKPTEEQAKLLEGLRARLRDPELLAALSRMLTHLDGEHAFEEISAKEGIKRAKVEEWLADLEDRGYLMTVRYI